MSGVPLDCDVMVVGAGLIGLSVARALVDEMPDLSVLVVEKEDRVAAHQSSHNSGVVHSGLYYKPGSLKARLAVEGRRRLTELCAEARIPYRLTGKLVVATNPGEFGALDELERRGKANGLNVRPVSSAEMRELEPEVVGVAGLFVPETGVVDFPAVAAHLAEELVRWGVRIEPGSQVSAIESVNGGVLVHCPGRSYRTRLLVNCAGLHSDRIAALAGMRTQVQVVPFRGEYYRLTDEAAGLVRGLVYPVPDPRFPFLGVHFTRGIDGAVEVGPNAVLALGREHYRGTPPHWRDFRETLAYPGFRRLARRHWRAGLDELVRSRVKSLYANAARNLIPKVHSTNLVAGGAGVRAQAVDSKGNLVDDFVIERSPSAIHVLNAPSPGGTASLAIGAYIADRARTVLNASAD